MFEEVVALRNANVWPAENTVVEEGTQWGGDWEGAAGWEGGSGWFEGASDATNVDSGEESEEDVY